MRIPKPSARSLDLAGWRRKQCRWPRWLDYPATIAAGMTGSAAVIFLACLIFRDFDLLLIGLALATCGVPFALAALQAPGRLLSPLTLLGATMLLGVAGQTVYLVFLATPEDKYALLSGAGQSGLAKGLGVVALGTLALASGYMLGALRKRTDPGRVAQRLAQSRIGRPSDRRMTLVVVGLCIAATASFVLFCLTVGISNPSDLLTSRKRFLETDGGVSALGYFRFGISLAGVGFLLGIFALVARDIRWISPLGIASLASLLITTFSAFSLSSRSDVITPVLIAALFVVAIREHEPRPRFLLAVLAVGLAAVTLLGGLRAVGQGRTDTLGEALGSATSFAEAPLASRDWMSIGPISAVTTRVPDEYPYQYGATMASILWAPVPRSIWPAKPPVRLGPEIGTPVYGFPPTRISGDPPGVIGEFWLNGGLPFAIVGMALLGTLLQWSDRWFVMIPKWGILSALVYAVLAVQLGLRLPIADVTGVLLAVIQLFLPLFAGLWLGREPGAGQGRPSAGAMR